MGRKLKFVLSDLHLGAGHVAEKGNHLEDFTADRELVDFLHTIWHESERDEREIELIINGDFFEFLQVPAVDNFDPAASYPQKAYHDSSQQASVQRLNIIVKGHQEVFNALSDFIHVEPPQRRITLIKGNHDVNLYWPGVKSHLREILGASGTRASLLLFADEFVSREKIYVEHGHQCTEKMNGYLDFFDPHAFDDPTQLYYPPGSRFVINYFNDIERKRWFIDHVKPITTLIWYALRWDFDFAAKTLAHFIRHTPALLVNDFRPDGPLLSETLDALLEDLENDDKRREMAQRYTHDAAFRQQLHQQIQQYLSDANVDNKGVMGFPLPEVKDDPLEMGRADQEQQQALLRHTAEEIAEQEGARVIIFGHTHRPVQESLSKGSVYVNTGSWIEDFSDASPETWQALFDGSQKPGDRPNRLPYARIDYDENNSPTGKLMFFDRKTGGAMPASAKAIPGSETRSFFEKNFSWITRILSAHQQYDS